MNTYIIRELQNSNSLRAGEKIQADSLSAAKRKATGMQMFQGTVMVIEAENGNVLARKERGFWV